MYSVVTSKSSYFWIPAVFMSISIGLLSISQSALIRSQQEIRTLTRIAERERISRDLHDILGHSLSIMTLKSELANKMLDKNQPIELVKKEIQDVESLSRETLARVRDAVKGYNIATLQSELMQARVATNAAGIELIDDIAKLELPQQVESEIALILREAITNVVRHADTKKAWVSLKDTDNQLILKIADEDSLIDTTHHSGMRSMQTRIDNLQGKMIVQQQPHTILTFIIPNEFIV